MEAFMKHKKKIALSVIVIGAGFALTSGILKGNQGKEEALAGDPKGKVVNVGEVSVQDIQAKIASTGIVRAKETEKIYSEANGKIEEVRVEVGDQVKKGDILITFDNDTKQNIERDLQQLDLQLENARIMLGQLQVHTPQSIMNAELNLTSRENAIMDIEEGMRQTKSSLAVAVEDYNKVHKQYEVVHTLHEEGLESQSKVDEAKKGLEVAKEQVASLESKLIALENNLQVAKKQLETATYDLDLLLNKVEDQTKSDNIQVKKNEIAALELKKESLVEQLNKSVVQVIAPMDGVVAQLHVEEGQMIASGAEMLRIMNPNMLIAKAEISPYYAAQLTEGLKVYVKFNGSTTIETTGTVSMVSPVAVQKQATNNGASTTAIPVEISIDDAKGLKEGLLVDLKIITEDVPNVLSVPLLATLEDSEDEAYLFVVGEKGVLEKRYVKEGAADNHHVQVSDVKEGELVVTNPTEALADGTTVSYKPLEEKTGDK